MVSPKSFFLHVCLSTEAPSFPQPGLHFWSYDPGEKGALTFKADRSKEEKIIIKEKRKRKTPRQTPFCPPEVIKQNRTAKVKSPSPQPETLNPLFLSASLQTDES